MFWMMFENKKLIQKYKLFLYAKDRKQAPLHKNAKKGILRGFWIFCGESFVERGKMA